MKRSRPLSLFLSFLILISCFTISVSASDSENLVDSDLRNWQIIHPDYTTVLYKRDNEFLIKVKPAISESNPDVKVTSGGVYHLTDLVNGNSYTLNFKYLNPSQMDVGEVLAAAPYLNGEVVIGLASKTGDNYELVENACITINKDNYFDYYGNNFSINFKMENIINPCIIFYYMGSGMGYEIYFGVGDVSLIDDSQAKEDGFFAKLFEWFQEKFDAIGESFTNLGNKLTELKNSFLDSLSNLGDTIGSFFVEQLEGIIEFFRGFGNLILYFNWEGEYTNPFEREDSPIDKVSEFFDNLIEYVDSIGTSIENVLDSITGGLHIFDEFTSRFPWLKGIAVFCLALIVITRFIGL